MKKIEEAYAPKYLVYIDPNDNRNKFIRIVPDEAAGTFTSEYGRIGAPSFQSKVYPLSKYDSYYQSKTKKGYIDQTNLVKDAVATTTGDDGFKAIADKDVNDLVRALRRYASETIKQNYTISQNAVTQQMLDSAKDLIDKLNSIVNNQQSQQEFNDTLVELFKTIPRKMNRVNEHLWHTSGYADAAKIIDREQKLYDILLASFQTQQAAAAQSNASNTNAAPTQTILESLGLECQLVTDKQKIDEIKTRVGDVAPNLRRVFCVVNKKTQDKYTQFMSQWPKCDTVLFFHGSRNENFWSILKNGLLLNPKAVITGKMLGLGIYFAPSASKSYGYVSLQGTRWANGNSNVGYLAIFAVAIDKNNMNEVRTSSELNACHGLTWDKLQKMKPGATCTYAYKGAGGWLRADELCIYREDQCTIRYLLELKI